MADNKAAAERVIEEWADEVSRMYGNMVSDRADEQAAPEAAANLLSADGGFLYAPTAMSRLVTMAIELGYCAALRDVREGEVDLGSADGQDVLQHPGHLR
jgi:hypothetical protein